MKLFHSLFLIILALTVSARPEKDKIKHLPGVNFDVAFDQYSGYLKATNTKYLHYWFVEAEKNPEKSPVLLWLQGGPGGSSLFGLLGELGPFHVKDEETTVYRNPFSWNTFANVLFLESPAGTGFSYDSTGNVTSNDEETGGHNHAALVDFFKNKFPEFRDNDFYLTGESYAGIFVPVLGAVLARDKANFPNFKGVAVGNGMFSEKLYLRPRVMFDYYHGLINQEQFDGMVSSCCDGPATECSFDKQTQECVGALKKEPRSPANGYNIYDNCYIEDEGIRPRAQLDSGTSCILNRDIRLYLNRDDVRKALHIPSHVGAWSLLSHIDYEWKHDDVGPELLFLVKSGIRVLSYNGDFDTVCDFIMNQKFIRGLGLEVDPQRNGVPWFSNGQVVGGYWTKYKNDVDFLTVRGAGHMVPQDQPEVALHMIYNFVNQRDYSDKVDLVRW